MTKTGQVTSDAKKRLALGAHLILQRTPKRTEKRVVTDARSECNEAEKRMSCLKENRYFRSDSLVAKRDGKMHHALNSVVELKYTTRKVGIRGTG
jgi:hypothetical protein